MSSILRLRSAKFLRRRRGVYMVLGAPFLMVAIGMAAHSIDLSVIVNTRVELQAAVDAGAAAGASKLVDGKTTATAEAMSYLNLAPVAGRPLTSSEIEIEFGEWDRHARTFSAQPSMTNPSAVRLRGTRRDAPMFFARLYGHETYEVTAGAVATFQPRDIVLVLDLSASMNDDSELGQISKLGRTAVENNLYAIYQELGSPRYGNMQWTPVYNSSTNNTTIRNWLGLTNVPYPYPSGSWNDYFSFVRSDSDVKNAGYQKKYGYLTLVQYWLKDQPEYTQTPDLWKTSEQPISSLKNAVSLFLEYIQIPDMDDQVALAVYTSGNGTALVEHSLTRDFAAIDSISEHRQAGHYDLYTNIGAGIKSGREELVSNARAGTLKLMVLMTDGQANRPSNKDPRRYALDEARATATAGIPILTISLGADADEDLMEDIAELSDGLHFNIPGGQTVDEYREDLMEAFQEIAFYRPLKLVQ